MPRTLATVLSKGQVPRFSRNRTSPRPGSRSINNLGDPWVDGAYPRHAKQFEREMIDELADMFRAPDDDRWGYVTANATEAILYGLRLARRLHHDGVVYHSAASHSSVAQMAAVLVMPTVAIHADDHDELDYRDLAAQVGRRRDRSVIVVATAGTDMAELETLQHRA